MSAQAPSRRRWKPVRVADVPYPERIRAAREAARGEPNPMERLRIHALAHDPGDLTAWIAA